MNIHTELTGSATVWMNNVIVVEFLEKRYINQCITVIYQMWPLDQREVQWLKNKLGKDPLSHGSLHAVVLQCATPPWSRPMYSDFLFHTLWTQSIHVVQAQSPLQTSLNCLSVSNITGLMDLKNIPPSHISSDPNYVQMKMLPHWLYYNNEPMPSWVSLRHPAARSVRVSVCVVDGANTSIGACFISAHDLMHLSSSVSQQMLSEASAAPPVMCCPLTFSNILKMQRLACQGQCTSLVDYEALPFINMPHP